MNKFFRTFFAFTIITIVYIINVNQVSKTTSAIANHDVEFMSTASEDLSIGQRQKQEVRHSLDDGTNSTIKDQDHKDNESTSKLSIFQSNQTASSFLTMYGEHRVEPALKELPKWFNDYFAWHRHETKNANKDTKYLVVTCLSHEPCGGISDRLRGLTYHLFIASRVKRVLCLHWEEPYPLQAFLKPPTNGMDWRCPANFNGQDFLIPNFIFEGNGLSKEDTFQVVIDDIKKNEDSFTSIRMIDLIWLDFINQQGLTKEGFFQFIHEEFEKDVDSLISIRRLEPKWLDQVYKKMIAMNQVNHSKSNKDNLPDLGRFRRHSDVMQHIFRVMFEPTELIAMNVNATMKKLDLVENQYTSVHVRNRYPTDRLNEIFGALGQSINLEKGTDLNVTFDGGYKEYSIELARNALECGQILAPNNTILLFSDEIELVKDLTSSTPSFKLDNNANDSSHQKIVGIVDSRESLVHLDAKEVKEFKEYFPLFEDLLIIGGSQCVSFGVGGFGEFGAALTGNKCQNIHRQLSKDLPVTCQRKSKGRLL